MNNFAQHNPRLRFLTKGLFWIILSLLCVFGVLSQMPGKQSEHVSPGETQVFGQGVPNSSPTTTARVHLSSTPALDSPTAESSLPTSTELATSSPTNKPMYGFVNLPAATATKKYSTTKSSSTPVIVTNTPVTPISTNTPVTPVESAPAVIGSSPVNGATGVALASSIYVNFSEAVTAPSAAVFNLECPVGWPIGFYFIGSGSTVFTIVPTGNLPAGTTCTVTVYASEVSDADLIDPPDSPATDYSFTFQTESDPIVVQPAIQPPSTSGGPNTAALNAPVSTTPTIKVVFSEPVDLSTGSFTLTCPGAIALNVSPALPASNQTSFNISPGSALTDGANCTLTVVASNVKDTDSNDPPDQMADNYTITFTVDAGPSEILTETEVGNIFQDVTGAGANNVDLDSNIRLTFSEAVNVIFPANGLQCPAGNNIPVTMTGSGSSTITLNPTSDFIVNSSCLLNIPAANISDSLSNHPNSAVAHTFQVLDDDAPTVTTNPSNGAVGIAVNANITVTLSEPVTLTGSWFQLSCTVSGSRVSTGELTGTGINIIENTPDLVYTLDPTVDFALGDICTITIDSANVTDNDLIDPPNQLDGDASSDFVDGDADDYVATFST